MTERRRALLSVFDKRGISEFAAGLQAAGYEIVSTGGTLQHLRIEGIDATPIAKITGWAEIFDGRLKTLHPRLFGGILQRRDNPGDIEAAAQAGLVAIDIVACNLYPFADTLAKTADRAVLTEQIDIGGPAMIRASAKNCESVFVATDPDDYPGVLSALSTQSGGRALRRKLAAKAFALTAAYDAVIALWAGPLEDSPPQRLTLPLEKVADLRYGENPHQQFAAHYRIEPGDPGAGFGLLHGNQPSYNNILDLQAAWAAANEFSENVCVALKHGNPCGLAVDPDQAVAFNRARDGDQQAIYGGVVAFNSRVELATVIAMRRVFLEVIVAPEYSSDALERLKRRATRVFSARTAIGPTLERTGISDLSIRGAGQSVLVQRQDVGSAGSTDFEQVTRTAASESQLQDLHFAFRAVKHVKSNAIVIASGGALVGVGAGQMSRVRAVELAVSQSGSRARGAVLASDAFFPFADGAEIALRAGVSAIVQPGGSKRDGEVVAACDAAGAAMVFSGRRHFRH